MRQTFNVCVERSHSQQRQDSDCGRSDIFLLCSSHVWHFPCWGENTDEWHAGSPCDLDHLGFKGLHMLQKRLHGLSCVDDGLREGKSKAWHGRGEGRGTFECRMKSNVQIVGWETFDFPCAEGNFQSTVYWQESINMLCIKIKGLRFNILWFKKKSL